MFEVSRRCNYSFLNILLLLQLCIGQLAVSFIQPTILYAQVKAVPTQGPVPYHLYSEKDWEKRRILTEIIARPIGTSRALYRWGPKKYTPPPGPIS